MPLILQTKLPFAPWASPQSRRLPGIQPIARGDWLHVDDAYASQMALRDNLISNRLDAVYRLDEAAVPAATELLNKILQELDLRSDFSVSSSSVTRPDGESVPLNQDRPLVTLGHLVQEDLCILQKHGDEHILTGAILCFPASWSLAEKIGKPLTRIHAPVAPYDSDLAKRVQRMFDAIRPEQPLWRANALLYDDPALHQPRREGDVRVPSGPSAPFVRSERQCLIKLPQSGAVVFSIHTYLVARSALSADQATALESHPITHVT